MNIVYTQLKNPGEDVNKKSYILGKGKNICSPLPFIPAEPVPKCPYPGAKIQLFQYTFTAGIKRTACFIGAGAASIAPCRDCFSHFDNRVLSSARP